MSHGRRHRNRTTNRDCIRNHSIGRNYHTINHNRNSIDHNRNSIDRNCNSTVNCTRIRNRYYDSGQNCTRNCNSDRNRTALYASLRR